ncbi:hypothetical protein N7465_005582 [Penicillium sp. CMV-2018d]|nr:hypothetical protein N7465_005582 [Penicillium sp. CMV-2018d]
MEEVVVEVTEVAEVITTAVTTTTSSNPTSCLHTTSQCVSKFRETISIESPPVPISQEATATTAPIPNRYHDPQKKHLAIEYEKRDRDIRRAAARAKAKETGGNNLTEGGGQGFAGPGERAMAVTDDVTTIVTTNSSTDSTTHSIDETSNDATADEIMTMDRVDVDEPFLHDGEPLHAMDVELPST